MNAPETALKIAQVSLRGAEKDFVSGVMSARPGRLIDIIETGWSRGRDGCIVEEAHFSAITARLWHLLRDESLKAIGKAGAAA